MDKNGISTYQNLSLGIENQKQIEFLKIEYVVIV